MAALTVATSASLSGVPCWDRVHPQQLLVGNLGAEEPDLRAHVAVAQLVPRLGECVVELFGVVAEPLRDRTVDRVHLHGHVGGAHHRGVDDVRVVRVGHRAGERRGGPLLVAGRALGEHPVVVHQRLEVVVVPLRRRGVPGALETAGGGVDAHAGVEAVLPAEELLLHRCALGLRAHGALGAGAVHLAEGVTADDQRHGLFVVHRHATERLADVCAGGDRVRIAVRAFGVHVDETHLDRTEWLLELPVAAVALIVEPDVLGAPVDVLLGRPDVFTTAGEAERLEAHRLERDVAGEDHQVGPGDLAAVLLLDGLQERTRLVEVAVVGPAVERGESLGAGGGATTTVVGPVGAGGVPGHANEERAVVAVVRGPPVLGIGHEGGEVGLDGGEVERGELGGVVEIVVHRIGLGRTLMEDVQVQLVRPPVLVGLAATCRVVVVQNWAPCFVGHVALSLLRVG